jgi:acyl-coenzyme A thioesterase PaaI-like protein
MSEEFFQDRYPDDAGHCFGCGRLNEFGLHIKSRWTGDETICHFLPEPYHISVPGYVYGGLLASLVDCHSTGTAAAAAMREAESAQEESPFARFLTASLHVDYLKPTPLGVTLELRSKVKEMKGRKVIVSTSVYANGIECARGEVVAVKMPDHYLSQTSPPNRPASPDAHG